MPKPKTPFKPKTKTQLDSAKLPDPKQTLYIIDISSFIFRAFFAVKPLSTSKGEPTNAIFGVATMLARIAQSAKSEFLAVAFDSKEPSFRKEIYSRYKANRTQPPERLIPQFERVEQLIHAFKIKSYRKTGVEADDLIASLTVRWCDLSPENKVVIVSSDKDLMQLINPRVSMWDTLCDKIYTAKEVQEKFGIQPSQIQDYLSLVGDSSDNIPGVTGVGPKTASELLIQYDTLNAVLKAAKTGEISGKKGELLRKFEDQARLAQRLTELKKDLDLELKPDDLKIELALNDLNLDLFRSLEFFSLIKKWGAKGMIPDTGVGDTSAADLMIDIDHNIQINQSGPSDPIEPFVCVQKEENFLELIEKIKEVKKFAIDLETTSLNPREAKVVGISLALNSKCGYYIPLGHQNAKEHEQLPLQFVLDYLRPLLENAEYGKFGQNLKYDWGVFLEMGIEPQGIEADTMVASYVLDPEGRHNLETLAQRFLGYDVMTYEQVCGKGKDQIRFDQVSIPVATRYSAEDAWIAFRLWEVFESKLKQDNLWGVYSDIDLPLISVLAKMEQTGVWIDVPWLNRLSQEFTSELKSIEQRIGAYTKGDINLNSPKQLSHLLFEELKLPVQSKTKTGFSTDAKVLAALAPLHEIPRLLLEYREIAKLLGTYVDPLVDLRDTKTKKVHASFHQAVTATGRLSSSNPNLQNIPIRTARGEKIRKAFIPSDGNVLVVADYSQIELRLLAHMSGDLDLVESFKQGEDIHRRTASAIFKVPEQEVNEKQRSTAKAINFGLMYGKTAFGLSEELHISRKEAQEVIHSYFERYQGVKTYLDQTIAECEKTQMVSTLFGRRRILPDIRSSNVMLKNNAQRMAMNTPIQGTAADLMKLGMIRLVASLEKAKLMAKLVIQVHDEVVLDCPKDEINTVKELVVDSLENIIELKVPLKVNVGVGLNWLDLK